MQPTVDGAGAEDDVGRHRALASKLPSADEVATTTHGDYLADMAEFVSRAGLKLEHALATFGIDVTGLICADLGCNAGGFTDCLLKRGATRVYAVDTGYGVLDWKLRKDVRVVVMERTNAMHVSIPEPVGVAVIDVAWTRQKNILPATGRLLGLAGFVVTLLKPHYEAERSQLRNGILPDAAQAGVLSSVEADITAAKFDIVNRVQSPIKGAKGNSEWLYWLRPAGA